MSAALDMSAYGNGLSAYGNGLAAQATSQALHGRSAVAQALQANTGANNDQSSAAADKARATAQDFEAVFLSQMFEQMWAGVEVDSNFGGGHAEEVWRSMLNQEYGKVMARSGGIGLADQLMSQVLKMQEAGTDVPDAGSAAAGQFTTLANTAIQELTP